MTPPPDPAARRRQIKLATIVVIAAIVLWMLVSMLGGALGLPVRFAFLADLAAMAAMIWALVVAIRVWRGTRDRGDV
ncbi:MAG: DUF5337 family protein [Pseudomonadota bacterium]